MTNHRWTPAKSSRSTRVMRWTHVCDRCLCRKGTSKIPGWGVRPLWHSKDGDVTGTRPDCVSQEKE